MKSINDFDLFDGRYANMDTDKDTGLKISSLETIFEEESPKLPPSSKIDEQEESLSSSPVEFDIPKDDFLIIPNCEGVRGASDMDNVDTNSDNLSESTNKAKPSRNPDKITIAVFSHLEKV